jgi:2-polyprenyl-3-methyl-5-hydroxy-6-metoxy-1,4-benzoquinol methylase
MSLAASTLNGDFSEIPETLYGPRKCLAWAYSILRTLKNPRVLDVGCGTEILLARRGIDIVGTDIHRESIEHAKTASAGLSNVNFVCGSPKDAPGQYVAIILSEVFEQ